MAAPGFQLWVKGLLEARGLDQEALADPMDRTPTDVSRVLKGRRGITLVDIERLASFFGVDEAEVFARAAGTVDSRRQSPAQEAGEIARRGVLEDIRAGRVKVHELEAVKELAPDAGEQTAPIELTYANSERPIWTPAAAALVVRGEPPEEEPRGSGVPPAEHEDDLGPDPIGIEIEGWSLIGAGVYSGDVAWVNPDSHMRSERPK